MGGQFLLVEWACSTTFDDAEELICVAVTLTKVLSQFVQSWECFLGAIASIYWAQDRIVPIVDILRMALELIVSREGIFTTWVLATKPPLGFPCRF